MLKRILLTLLAALMLASLAAPASLAEGEARLVCDAAAPLALADGRATVSPGTNANELLACFVNKAAVTLTDASGAALSATDKVGSGATLACGEDTATVVVPGDLDGNAAINARDVFCAMSAIVGADGRYFADAADVDCDKSINGRDVVKLMRYLVGWNETLGAEHEKAASEDEALTVYFASAMQRIAREDTAIHGTDDGVIRMAKNEIEDAHILLVSTEAKSGLTLEIGDIKNAAGDVLEREVRYGYYYDTAMFNDLNSQDFDNYTQAWWADPYPVLSGDFAIGANESKSFIVKVKTTASTAAGWYSASVRVLDPAKNELKKATLFVYVWNFAIKDENLSYTMFNSSSSGLAGYFGPNYYDGNVWAPFYKEYWYDYMLENKMCLEDLPYSLGDSRVDEYLDDVRVTSFVTQKGREGDCWHGDNAASTVSSLRWKYEKLKQKDEWLEKAYIYTVDEPWMKGGSDMIIDQWNNAKAALDGVLGEGQRFQTIVPYYNNWMSEINMDQTEYLWDYCNCFCPDAYVFTPSAPRRERIKDPVKYPSWGFYMEDKQIAKYGPFEPRYEAMRERGDNMWWYTCISPGYPHANLFNYYQGAWTRVVFWQQYLINADGFLYYSINFWNMDAHDNRGISLRRTNNGDGLLAYPGSFWDEGPTLVPSIRFEQVRDGLEDYVYLRQLEAYVGRDAALEYSNRITTDMLRFTQDWRDISGTRDEIGFMLESFAAE